MKNNVYYSEMSNNMPKTISRQQRYCKENREKIIEISKRTMKVTKKGRKK